jgi:hypothetical protein
MAVYKVPQDVEADDKLIGPFSFRQFIYLVIVAGAGFIAWLLFQLFPPLAIIPLPVILLFGSLALPLRKDQPMEVFMAAMVSFYLKPRRRLWDPDGIDSLVEIVSPKTIDFQLTKDLSTNEAERRLSYLAEIVDSRGWAVRNPGGVQVNSAMNSDVYFEAQAATDILDNDSFALQQIDSKLAESSNRHHQDLMNLMKNAQPEQVMQNPVVFNEPEPKLVFNPYPEEIHQKVIQPLYEQAQIQPEYVENTVNYTSNNPVSTDIINLASNNDLSIATIAHEANRIAKKQEASEEVVISLR